MLFPREKRRESARLIGRRLAFAAPFAICANLLRGQREERPKRYPDGRSVDLELTRRDHRKVVEQVAEIRSMAVELEQALERDTAHVVSLDSLRKLEQIEELARSARERLKRVY